MPRSRPFFRLPCFVLMAALAMTGPLMAQTAAETPPPDNAPAGTRLAYWFGQAARAFESDRVDDWVEATEQLHELRPYNQDFMTHLVVGHARQGDLSNAFNMMLHMQQQGLAEDWSRFDELAPLREHRLYDHLVGLMSEAGQPFGRFEEQGQLPEDLAMPEGIARDPASGRVFVGSVRDGRILARVNGEEWSVFAAPEMVEGLASVFALAVDSERGHLWVATGMAPQFEGFDPDAVSPSALIKLDLASGERIGHYRVASDSKAQLLGSMVVADDGTVYAADTRQPVVFRLAPDAEVLQPFFGNRNLSSLRGLALSGDNKLLYMADYEQGIFVLTTDGSNQGWKLAVPETLNEGGIDGLYWWEGHLIAIQNGISPQRVLRLELGPDGLGVVAVAPVLAALEVFDTPTYGVMEGSRLVMFSGSHWQHVDGSGQPLGETLPTISLLETDIDAAEVMVVGQEALEQLQGQR
ncbi:MAG: SMP-30/gluconolactonase/LRE family protein [Wenzhouxiangella sp.]